MTEVQPKQVIESVFGAAGVQRVVSIDDNYDPLPPLSDLLGALGALAEEIQQRILSPFPELFSTDPEILEKKVSNFWETGVEEQKRELVANLKAHRVASKVDTVDAEALPKLHDLFRSYEFKLMGLTEWRSEADKIFQESQTRKTLVMFDEDLSKHGGTKTEGLKLIEETFAKTAEDHLICCLVSHNYHLDTVHEAWKKICSERNFPENRFVIIPKDLLIDQPLEFAGLVKLTVVTKSYAILKSRARDIFRKSLETADAKIEDMTIYDFDQIVFQSSDREGVWEPDTFFRLLSIFHRTENRHKALTDKDLRQASSDVRRISGIATPSKAQPTGALYKIQHLENYEEADQINQLHRPTDLGDIYEKTGGRRYILIAPQCDLMVRTLAGFRGNDADLLKEGILAEIVARQPQQGLGWELEFYSESRPMFVDFKKGATIKLTQLDLCVFNQDGSSKFCLKDQPSPLLIPAWEKRHQIIRVEIERMFGTYDRMDPLPRQKTDINTLLTRSSSDSPFVGFLDPTSQTVQYNFKRVARLLPPRSTALINAYARFLGRDAFEHAFGKTIWKEPQVPTT